MFPTGDAAILLHYTYEEDNNSRDLRNCSFLGVEAMSCLCQQISGSSIHLLGFSSSSPRNRFLAASNGQPFVRLIRCFKAEKDGGQEIVIHLSLIRRRISFLSTHLFTH